MKLKFFLIFGIVYLVLCLSGVYGLKVTNGTSLLKANILEDVASISVQGVIFFGNLTKGFESDDVRVNISNTGTSNVQVTPLLNGTDAIFSNTYFARRTTDNYVKIGSWSMNISRDSQFGGRNDDYCYAMLNLTGYTGTINNNMINHNANVIFWVMAV